MSNQNNWEIIYSSDSDEETDSSDDESNFYNTSFINTISNAVNVTIVTPIANVISRVRRSRNTQRKCSICKLPGHDRRRCPTQDLINSITNPVQESTTQSNTTQSALTDETYHQQQERSYTRYLERLTIIDENISTDHSGSVEYHTVYNPIDWDHKPDHKPHPVGEDTVAPENQQTCVVCLTNTSVIASVDCGHKCCCFNCSKQIVNTSKKCPICRQKWSHVIRIW
ncbi:MAG: RING finger protein [Candidatus Kariarchaeaceae archaeon]|jgi:hypothetical protein